MGYECQADKWSHAATHLSEVLGDLEHEAAAQARLGSTEDHRHAVESFLVKEKPVFHGR